MSAHGRARSRVVVSPMRCRARPSAHISRTPRPGRYRPLAEKGANVRPPRPARRSKVNLSRISTPRFCPGHPPAGPFFLGCTSVTGSTNGVGSDGDSLGRVDPTIMPRRKDSRVPQKHHGRPISPERRTAALGQEHEWVWVAARQLHPQLRNIRSPSRSAAWCQNPTFGIVRGRH